jgi:hypothetical protein
LVATIVRIIKIKRPAGYASLRGWRELLPILYHKENPDFKGVYRCLGYVDGREPEGQIEMEEKQ